jgi:hypothetical protein
MANKSTRLPGTEFESTGNRARSVASGSPGSAGLNRSVATDIGAGALVALEALQKINAERDAVTSVKAESAYVIEREKKMAELDPMAADYPERIKQIWGDGKDVIAAAGLTTPAAQADLERRFARHGASAELIGIKLRKDAVSREGLLTAKDTADAIGAKIRNDPANANAYLAEFQGSMERLKGVMDPNQMREFARTAADKLAGDQIFGYAEKGNFAAARAALKEQAPNLSRNEAEGLSRHIDSKESKARADGDRARTQNIATYLVDVDDQFSGNKEINPNNRANLDAMKAKGAISPEGYLTAVRTLNNREENLRKEQAKDAVALEEFNTGTPKNQENLDRAVNIALGRIPIGRIAIEGTPEQRATAIKVMAGIAGTSGMLYGQFKDLLENSDKTTDKSRAGQVAFAAEAADDLENTAPRALDNAKLDKVGTLAIVRSEAKRMIEQGMPKAEAYKQAASTYMSKGPLTITEENDRKEALSKSLAKIDLASKVQAATTSWGERNVPFVKLPGQDAALQGEWKRAYETAYMRTGSEEQAEAIAKTALNQIFGTTMVGAVGKPADPNVDVRLALVNPGMDPAGSRSQIARRPIERYSPPSMRALPQEEQARIYQNQIEPGLKTAGINLVKDPKFPHLSSYRLVADNQTEQDLRDGRLPTYQVQVLRVGGEGEYYNVDGMKRFRPPTEAEVLQDPTYIEINNARLMNDMKARQFDVRQQTEKARNTERMGNRPPLRRGAE